ncbi:hypothetical protein CsatA_014589 [Cannabis sativa]
MGSGSQESRPWTLDGLIRAFIDLFVAYILLCISTFMFFASNFWSMFGLDLPCPCSGFLGYQNGCYCWHNLLIDWPIRKIYDVQMSVRSKFPFDLVWSPRNSGNGFVELESEACCSSRGVQNLVDRENGFDSKGKKLVNLKQRTGFRRRSRRATLVGYGKFAPVFPNESLSSSVASVDPFGPQDVVNAPIGNYKGEESCHSFELSGSFGDSNNTCEHPICSDKHINVTEEKSDEAVSEYDKVGILERALEEEKAACVALYLELEKERAAAASAADEAMAMISRLQKDKASIEFEARQSQRMIEERFAYDEEEMDILKEILVKRERENLFLEKEVETYRRMSFTGDEQSQGDFSETMDEWGQRPLSSHYSSPDSQLMLQMTVNADSGYNHMENDADSLSIHEVPIVEEQIDPIGHDLVDKTVLLVGKEAEATEHCTGDEKILYCDRDELQKNETPKNHVDNNI